MKLKNIKKIMIVCCTSFLIALPSCDYLDVVPDDVATIEHAFRNRAEAEKYLYGCFSFLPDVGNPTNDPAMLGGDEVWIPEVINAGWGTDLSQMRNIIMGNQGTVSPYANYWTSMRNGQTLRGGKSLWTGISDCNIFLENIHLPYDLPEYEMKKWTGEALFVKAYLHYWLFRQYGPIPLIRDNQAIDTDAESIQQYREPVDTCVNYIVSLLDQAAALLPVTVENPTDDLGRPDRCIALALKAQVLTLAASPLFNCNPDYADYVDNRGVQLFPQDESVKKEKWEKAVKALKGAIDTAHLGMYELYNYRKAYTGSSILSEETILSMNVRGAVTDRWNTELIWGNSRGNNNEAVQRMSAPYFSANQGTGGWGNKVYAPTLRTVKQFYTKNGIPIEDDADWEGKNIWNLRTATTNEKQYIRVNYQTAELHFEREPRFYGMISFDGGTFYGNNNLQTDNSSNNTAMPITEMKLNQLNGYSIPNRSSITGYICKKMVSRLSSGTGSTAWSNVSYAYPVIRLADLYLMYAEALNEWKNAPDAEVYEYIDKVRARSGLKGVAESWAQYAVGEKKNKPATQEGMREIIQRERMIELAFEGARYWDLRRWKLAEEYLNQPIMGLDVMQSDAAGFYQEITVFNPKFELKDYFSPIRTNALVYNLNLLQSPGWE